MCDAIPAGFEDRLRGFGVLVEACAEALLNEPDSAAASDVLRVADALGDPRFNGAEPSADLQQRYYDRFFVSTSPFFVPLAESSVREAYEDNGRMAYGPTTSSRADHVLKCYQAVGFDYRTLEGFELAVKNLKVDSMASELAFLAFLAQSAANAAQTDVQVAQRAEVLLNQFAREHAAVWFGKATQCLCRAEDDYYARVAALAAEAVESLEVA